MSTGPYRRWYLLPSTTRTVDGETQIVPKYLGTSDDGIRRIQGCTMDPADVTPSYPALTQVHPDIDPWYILGVEAVGTAGWNKLNAVSIKGDTRNLATRAADVRPILNRRFGVDRDAAAWAKSFGTPL